MQAPLSNFDQAADSKTVISIIAKIGPELFETLVGRLALTADGQLKRLLNGLELAGLLEWAVA